MAASDETVPAACDEKAPEPPRIKRWNRRILQIGCLPVMIAGFLAAMQVPYVVEIGTALAIFVGLPIAAYTWTLRRRNQSAFDQATAEAAERGMRVRFVEEPSGDYTYVLEDRDAVERLDDFYEEPDPDAS